MADNVAIYPDRRQPGAAWSAIFAGTFAFLAIMATFEALGLAIFAGSVAGANSTGITVWTTILAIVALTIGGRAAGQLSHSATPDHATYIGLVTFGLSVFAIIVSLALIGGTLGAAAGAGMAAGHVNTAALLTTGGWGTFVALLLGLGGCVWGAHSAIHPTAAPSVERPSNLRSVA